MSDSPYNTRPGGAGLPRNLQPQASPPPAPSNEPEKPGVLMNQRPAMGVPTARNGILSTRKKAEAMPAALSIHLAKPVELQLPSGEFRNIDLQKELGELLHKNDTLGGGYGVKSEMIRRILALGVLMAKGEYR